MSIQAGRILETVWWYKASNAATLSLLWQSDGMDMVDWQRRWQLATSAHDVVMAEMNCRLLMTQLQAKHNLPQTLRLSDVTHSRYSQQDGCWVKVHLILVNVAVNHW